MRRGCSPRSVTTPGEWEVSSYVDIKRLSNEMSVFLFRWSCYSDSEIA